MKKVSNNAAFSSAIMGSIPVVSTPEKPLKINGFRGFLLSEKLVM